MKCRVTPRERKRQRNLSLICSPDGYKRQGWFRPKPAHRHSAQVSPLRGRGPSTWAIKCCFPRRVGEELDQSDSYDLNQNSGGMLTLHYGLGHNSSTFSTNKLDHGGVSEAFQVKSRSSDFLVEADE